MLPVCRSFPDGFAAHVIPIDTGDASDDKSRDDVFLDIVLNPNVFMARSFAFGGMPYFEKTCAYDKDVCALINNANNGILSKDILDLFYGMTDEEIGEKVYCHIVDARNGLPIESKIFLRRPKNVKEEKIVILDHGFASVT